MENPAGKLIAWTLGLGAAAVAGIAGIALLASGKKKAAPAPPTPAWSRAAVNPTTNSVWLPNNSTFAISVPGDDANVANIVANLNSYASAGMISSPQSISPGQNPPAGWPADNLGTNAYRYTGVVTTGGISNVGGVGVVVDQSTLAWIFAGVKT